MKTDIVVDVESDGPVPGLYSMVSFAAVPLYNDTKSFYSPIQAITDNFQPDALRVCNFTREQTLGFPDPQMVMTAFGSWAEQFGGPLVLWSDNPLFDGAWFNYYCHKYLGKNPFGFSGRRIGDLYAGFVRDPSKTSDWKKFRTGTHTHNALDDAKGNAGALRRILREIKESK